MVRRLLLVLMASLAGLGSVAAQEKIRVGYWTSGFSVCFGAA